MCQGKVNEFVPFEKDLIALVKNVKFRKVKNYFQKKLQHDIKMIRTSDKSLTFVFKTNNMYILSKDQCNNSITSTHKESNNNIKKKINISRRNILKDKEVLNKRTEITSKCRQRNKYALASYDSMEQKRQM